MSKKLIILIMAVVVTAAATNQCRPDECLIRCCDGHNECGRFVADCLEFGSCKTSTDCGSTQMACFQARCIPQLKVAQVSESNERESSVKVRSNLPQIVRADVAINQTVSILDPLLLLSPLKITPSANSTAFSSFPEDFDSNTLTMEGIHQLISTKKEPIIQIKSIAKLDLNEKDLAMRKMNDTTEEAFPKYRRQNAKIFDDEDNDEKLDDISPGTGIHDHDQKDDDFSSNKEKDSDLKEGSHARGIEKSYPKKWKKNQINLYQSDHLENKKGTREERQSESFYYHQSPVYVRTVLMVACTIILFIGLCKLCQKLRASPQSSLQKLNRYPIQSQTMRFQSLNTANKLYIKHISDVSQPYSCPSLNGVHREQMYQAIPSTHPQFNYYQLPVNQSAPQSFELAQVSHSVGFIHPNNDPYSYLLPNVNEKEENNQKKKRINVEL